MTHYFFSFHSSQINRVLFSLFFFSIITVQFIHAQEITETSNEELLDLMETTDVQVIDVRTSREVSSGKIEGANNINFFDKDFKAKAGELDLCKPVAVYCLKGKRSSQAALVLSKMGFMQIYNLTNGYDGWIGEQYPNAKNEGKAIH